MSRVNINLSTSGLGKPYNRLMTCVCAYFNSYKAENVIAFITHDIINLML